LVLLVATTKASAFSFTVCTLPPNNTVRHYQH
jgi:hypothetical protein